MKKILLTIALCLTVMLLSARTWNNPAPDSVFTFTAKLYYPVNVTTCIDSYMENAVAIKAIATLIKDNFTVESIKISGWSSPESSSKLNKVLSEKRAATIKKIIQDQYGYADNLFIIEGNGEQWNAIEDLIDGNDELVCKYMEEFKLAMAKENLDAREMAIKAIGKGELYRHISKTVFPKLRYADCVIKYRCTNISDEDAEILNIKIEKPVTAPVVEPEPVVETPAEAPVEAPVEEVAAEENTVEPEETNWGRWRFSIAAGPQFYYGDNDRYLDNKDRIRLGIYANIDRWFNDYIGMGIGINAAGANGLYHDHYALNDDDPRWRKPDKGIYRSRDGKNYFWQKTWLFNPSVYVVTNLLNVFGGKKEGGRTYNLLLSAGVGVPFAHSSYHDKTYAGFSMNASLINSFRITDHFDLQILLNGGALNDKFDGEVSKHVFDGTASIMGGFAWRF